MARGKEQPILDNLKSVNNYKNEWQGIDKFKNLEKALTSPLVTAFWFKWRIVVLTSELWKLDISGSNGGRGVKYSGVSICTTNVRFLAR